MTASTSPARSSSIRTENFLYLVEQGGKARRYGVGVGKPGFDWAGTHKVTRKANGRTGRRRAR